MQLGHAVQAARCQVRGQMLGTLVFCAWEGHVAPARSSCGEASQWVQ